MYSVFKRLYLGGLKICLSAANECYLMLAPYIARSKCLERVTEGNLRIVIALLPYNLAEDNSLVKGIVSSLSC